MYAIELIAGLGYLIGHYFLSQKKILGWPIKIIGGIGWATFLYLNQNYIFMAVQVVIVLTMIYGFYKWTTKFPSSRTAIDKLFEVLAIVVGIFAMGVFILKGEYSLGQGVESLIVTAEVVGTMLLARHHIAGWYNYIVMSLLVAVLVIFINPAPAILIGLLELASIYFYIKGIQTFSKESKDIVGPALH